MNQYEITAYVSFKQELTVTAETYDQAEEKAARRISGLLGETRKSIQVHSHITNYTELPYGLKEIHLTLLDLGHSLEEVKNFAAYQAENIKSNG